MYNLLVVIFLYIITAINTFNCAHNNRNNIENLALLAFEHGVKVREKGSCSIPRPEIVYVTKDNPFKVYLPRGTILHRCSNQGGCCPHVTQNCKAIESETVHLYFFTVTLMSNGTHRHKRPRQQQNIEKISFTNHTRCACMDRNFDFMNEI